MRYPQLITKNIMMTCMIVASLIVMGTFTLADQGKGTEVKPSIQNTQGQQAGQIRDKIYTHDGWVEFGEIIADTDKGITLSQANGRFEIPRDRLNWPGKVILDYSARAERLSHNKNPDKYFQLGLMCEKYNMPEQALQAYKHASEQPGAPIEVFMKLGGLYEKKKEWVRAAESYRSYLQKNPSRKDAIERLNTVEVIISIGESTQDNPSAKKAGPEETTEITETTPAKNEGMEAIPGWTNTSWGNSATVSIVPSQENDPKGNQILCVDYKKEGKDKVAIERKVVLDLSQKTSVNLQVFNQSDRSIGLALAMATFPGYQYFESRPEIISPGAWKSDLTFSLNSPTFKSEKSGWKYTNKIENSNDVRRLFLLIYHSTSAGKIFFDQIQISPQDKLPAEIVNPKVPDTTNPPKDKAPETQGK